MDNGETDYHTPARPWNRCHLSTWLALLFPTVVLVLANIPGNRVDLPYQLLRDAPIQEHGWPFTWLVRQAPDRATESLWALTENVCYLDGPAAAADLFVSLALLASVAAMIEWRRRRRHRVWQFTIMDLLVVVLIACFPLKVVSERRQTLARIQTAARGAELGEIASWELSLPHWLHELLPETEFADAPLVWLGLLRPVEVSVTFPEQQSEAGLIAALIDAGPDAVNVCIRNPPPPDNYEQPPLEPASLQSLVSLRHLTLERADDGVMACLDFLPELRSLKFDVNCGRISRSAAAHLKELHKLQSLDASHACLGDAGVEAVVSHTTIEALSLAGACDSDLALLSRLKRLRCLELLEAKITDEGLAPLAELPHLERLSLSGAQITGTGLARLAGLPKLWHLDLAGSGLTDEGLAGLRKLGGLRVLDLANTPITGALTCLDELKLLRRLNLCGTEIRDLALSHLPALPRLEDLVLCNTRITEQGLIPLNRLHALRELDLAGTRVASLAAIDLDQMPTLVLIDICTCNSWITFDERQKVSAARPTLSFSHFASHYHRNFDFERELAMARQRGSDDVTPIRVWLGGRTFGDRELAALRGLAIIESLQMESTRLTEGGLAILTEFGRLQWLDLTSSPITDAGLASLSKLSQLRHLDLSYTDVTPEGVARLAELPELECIVLDPSQISVEAVENLKRLPALRRLAVSRERAPWGKQYRGAADFDEFLGQLREDLPRIEVAAKDYSGPHRCMEF